LQLSVNGKVIKYAQPAKVRVADAIARAGKGENAAVATTVRTLAAASSNNNNRSSQAGATRVEGGQSEQAKDLQGQAGQEARDRASTEITNRTGVENPIDVIDGMASHANRNETTVILEPRSTAVYSNTITFRWLRSPGIERYVVSVRNHVGDEIWHTETADTAVTWPDASLVGDALYTWTLAGTQDAGSGTEATFHRLDDSARQVVQNGVRAIERELGADNPALPLVMGAYLADYGCLGEAARAYTGGALAGGEHHEEFEQRAIEIYRDRLGLSEDEMRMIAAEK
jgi:hypothetical protein